jgi:DNA-binding response OmpR family regulator
VTKRLLITDDEQSIVFALTRYFSQAGYEIDGATELDQAQALLDAREYALVIADLALTKGGKGECRILRTAVAIMIRKGGWARVGSWECGGRATAFLHGSVAAVRRSSAAA